MTTKSDDPTILDSDPLWRRIHPKQVVHDGQGCQRPSSAAFVNSSDGTGMSVTLGPEAENANVSPLEALRGFAGFALASLPVVVCRMHDQTLERAPTSDDPHHALVDGEKPRSVRRALCRAASWAVPPNPTEA